MGSIPFLFVVGPAVWFSSELAGLEIVAVA